MGRITPHLWFDKEAVRPPSSEAEQGARNASLLQMKKFDLAELERAYQGEDVLVGGDES